MKHACSASVGKTTSPDDAVAVLVADPQGRVPSARLRALERFSGERRATARQLARTHPLDQQRRNAADRLDPGARSRSEAVTRSANISGGSFTWESAEINRFRPTSDHPPVVRPHETSENSCHRI
jgi:hypothetical protein